MSKYSALFNSPSGSGDTTTTTTTGATDSLSSPSCSNGDAGSSAGASATSTATTTVATSSSPRSRLVRRRRDGAAKSEVSPSLPSSTDAQNTNDTNTNATSSRSDARKDNAEESENTSHASETPVASPPIAARGVEEMPRVGFFEQGEEDLQTQLQQQQDAANAEGVAADSINRSVDSPADVTDAALGIASVENGKSPSADSFSSALSPSSSSSSSSSTSPTSSPVCLYTCDACLHFVTSSYGDLARHALEQHADLLVDYTRLRTVAEKLVPVWPQVLQRKRAVIQKWGEEVFRVAVQRDAGAAKMAEAHRARAQLELVVQRWHPNARVFIFGSSVAFGVWDGISDIDFTVVDVEELEAGLWPPSEKNAVRTITELLRRAGFSFINLEPISHARVPIIKHHASLPIRLTDEQRRRLREEAQAAAAAAAGVSTSASTALPPSHESSLDGEGKREGEEKEDTQLEAELIIARSVRYTLNLPASALDSAMLEASIRLAVGSAAVQQVWWNRSREMCCMTFDTTTNAIRAATCPLHFASAGMRARVQPLHEECRPELYGMDFDLSFRAFGIRNSHLLRRYLLSHPCARPGALVLKDWSKSSGVNNSVNGYLTSYAINIMWIYYLVHHHLIPYVSPTDDIPASLRGNVSGDPEYAPMVDATWSAEELAAMQAQAGELLLGFFYYYAFDFDWEHHVVSLNRPGVTTKAMLGWDVEDVAVSPPMMDGAAGSLLAPHLQQQQQMDFINSNSSNAAAGGGPAARRSRMTTTRYSFCIEDPYEENLNLGRHMGVTKTLRVQTELYRGLLSLLKDDVHHCCVFAGSAASTEATQATTQRSAHAGGEGNKGEPTELPLRVLYRLMAISTRELAAARLAHPPTATSSKNDFPGILLEELTAAFAATAPAEWKVASNAWNVHQLLHRLGLKLHEGRYVLPRREIGMRRLASQVPPGVVLSTAPEPTIAVASYTEDAAAATTKLDGEAPAASAAAPQITSAAEVADRNCRLLQSVRTRYLSSDLMLAVARGYEHLTPQWVAWSKPWAALSAWWTDRRPTLAVAPAEQQKTGSTLHNHHSSSRNSNSSDGRQTSSPASSSSSSSPRVSVPPKQTVGAMRQTRKQLMYVDPAQGVRWHVTADLPVLTRSGGSKRAISAAVGVGLPLGAATTTTTTTAAATFSSLGAFHRVSRLFFH